MMQTIHMKTIGLFWLLSSIILMACSPSAAQTDAGQQTDVVEWLRSRDFQFAAQSMTTLRGKREYLSGGYRFIIRGDTLHSKLPFKGRSTQAPMNPDEAGYFFTSTEFNYNLTEKTQDSWMLKMEITDQRFARSFHLLIFNNGKANLDIYSNFRDPVHFSGTLQAVEKP